MARRTSLAVSLVLVSVLAGAATACTGTSEPTPVSGGTLPQPSDPDTLLPVPVDSQPTDVTGTLPPDLLFGGDLCSALTAADIAAVPIAGVTGARLGEAVSFADDQCNYDVRAGIRRVSISVKARSLDDFVNPSPAGEAIDEISGLGLAARGVQHIDGYELLVKVANGFFAVVAPDRAAAEALAKRAISRATP